MCPARDIPHGIPKVMMKELYIFREFIYRHRELFETEAAILSNLEIN